MMRRAALIFCYFFARLMAGLCPSSQPHTFKGSSLKVVVRQLRKRWWNFVRLRKRSGDSEHANRSGRKILSSECRCRFVSRCCGCAGHVNAEYGQRYPGGAPSTLVLAPGQRAMDLRIAMTRAGVVSGHITDRGQPISRRTYLQ
jgi:hypothetical protein